MSQQIRISKGRFEAFSDGIFAIAATLLVLELPIPKLALANEHAMTHALLSLWPQLLVYVASFITIGINWFNHYALFHHAREITYSALVTNLILLLLIAFLPYPTWLLGQYGLLRAAVFFYGATFFAIGVCWSVLWYVATLEPGSTRGIVDFLRTRNAWNTLGPTLYAVGSGVGLLSPIAGIFTFVAVAVFYFLPGSVRSALASSAAAHSVSKGP